MYNLKEEQPEKEQDSNNKYNIQDDINEGLIEWDDDDDYLGDTPYPRFG